MNKSQFEEAKKQNELSYSPYSHYRVSAAVLLTDGKIVSGMNIENSAFGLSICAERCTLFKVYSMGYKKDDIVSLLIYTNRKDSVPYPCGSCRQVMRELMNLDAEVIVVNDLEKPEYFTVDSLLPNSFGPESL